MARLINNAATMVDYTNNPYGTTAAAVDTLVIPEEGSVNIGGLVMTCKELKLCLGVMLKVTKEEYPEEFI